MLDQIISTLKEKVGNEVVERTGLDRSKADAAISEAGASLNDVAEKEGPASLMEKLSGGSAGITGLLENDYVNRLTSKLGIEASTANKVKDMVLPALMGLLQSKGGDLLGSFMGGKDGEGMAGGIADKLGGLGKMFGK